MQEEGARGQLASAHGPRQTDLSEFKPAFRACGWEEQKHPRPCDRQRPRALRAGRGGGQAHSAATELRGRGPQGRSCFPSTAVCSFPFSFSVPTAFMTVSAAAFLPVLPAVAGGAGGCVSRDTQG